MFVFFWFFGFVF